MAIRCRPASDQSTSSGKALAAWLGQLPSPIAPDNVPITDLLPGGSCLRSNLRFRPRLFPCDRLANAPAKGRSDP